MAYNYFCTYCGKELDQERVFFNMFPVLTGNKLDKFGILQFNMTKKELEKLVTSGLGEENGYSRCIIGFAEMMKYISNDNNLNDPEIATITIQDIDDYTEESYEDLEDDISSAAQNNDDLFGESSSTAANQSQDEMSGEPAKEKEIAKGILALEARDTRNEDPYFTRMTLRRELKSLRNVFSQGETCEFEINLDFENDNNGKPVLIGYIANAGSPKRLVTVRERLCPYCDKPVIEHAGTAEHKTITFIGDQKAGKTSTIVALAHYAVNAAADNMPAHTIWQDCSCVGGVDTIEIVNNDSAMERDLCLYSRGIAPKKTTLFNREDAYSVSFRIKNNYQNKHYLLTLTDLPGELFDNKTGRLKTEDILQVFPAALACDLLVLCFDTKTAKGDMAIDMVRKAGGWTNDIQKVRQDYVQSNNRDKGLLQKIKAGEGAKALSAPIMILYTKCSDLEELEVEQATVSRAEAHDRIARTYMFDKERRSIDGNSTYRYLGERLMKYDMVANAYQSRLRCSPFGFPAPNELDIKEHPENYEFREENGESIPILPSPEPKHIHLLMRWLLMISGCIPVTAEYRPYADPTSTKVFMPKEKYFITQTQYRMLNPGATHTGTDKNADLYDALARCYLFENPGRHDRALLSDYDNWALLLKDRLAALMQRN